MRPIKIKLNPADRILVYIVADEAAFSVKRHDGSVAILVLSRGEWEIAMTALPSPGQASIHVTKAIV